MKGFFYWLIQEVSAFTWVLTIGLDLLWNLVDGASIFTGVGIICYPFVMMSIFAICFITVAFVQHYISFDKWKMALKKATIFGLIAALPFSIVSFLAGGIGLLVRESMGQDYTYIFGKLGLNYRELEKIIKQKAVATRISYGNWRDISMDTAINTFEQEGKISRQEAHELHQLRLARNQAHHEETPADLFGWVEFSEGLLQKYQNRFGTV